MRAPRCSPRMANPLALPKCGQGLMAIDDVLMDIAKPHFSEMETAPAGLPPSQKQQSGVSKVIQHGTQPETGKEREK